MIRLRPFKRNRRLTNRKLSTVNSQDFFLILRTLSGALESVYLLNGLQKPWLKGRPPDAGFFCFMDYRKFYEEKTKRRLPKNWEIHHINFNREDNSIENLLALPQKIHAAFHRVYYTEINFLVNVPDLRATFQNINVGFYRMQLASLHKISLELDRIFIYTQYKEFLLGNLRIDMNHLY